MRHTIHKIAALFTPVALALCIAPHAANSAPPTKKTPPKKADDGGQSRGTKQVAGGDGIFGVVYTLNSGFNFTILSARYTIEPHNDYNGSMAQNDEKLVWITFAVKNSDKDKDHAWGNLDVMLVDDKEQTYTPGSGTVMLTSRGNAEFSATLKPGQGIGQEPAKDELSCAIAIPAKAKIKRIILNEGRKNLPGEKVVRYNIAGFQDGSPKNVIAALPKYAADPADATGATVAIPATALPGTYYPAGDFALRFDGLTFSEDAVLDKNKPEDGKRYAIATFTAKNEYSKPVSTFELGGQNDEIFLRDADGEKYKSAVEANYALRKAKRDEALATDLQIAVGEEITYRFFFLIPKDAKPASITFGQGKYGHAYKVDVK